MDSLLEGGRSLLTTLILLGGTALVGLLIHTVFIRIAPRFTQKLFNHFSTLMLKYTASPLRIIFPVAAVLTVLPFSGLTAPREATLRQLLALTLIGCIGWLMVRFLAVLEELSLGRYRLDVQDNLEARRAYTQIRMLRRVAVAMVFTLTIASMLMTFDRVRQLGASILASAGIAGIILGFAAQKSLSALVAGLQVAISQPIRIDDVVIVENEWGRIEEITMTYVVVRIWDQRRLIVPTNYFIEKPFQNWTRVSTDLLGTVFLYVDYTVPIGEVRNELHSILDKSPIWDRRVWNLQVTNTTDKTMELRALMSAGDASKAWDLRCEVREKLISFIREKYPQSLPKQRAEITGKMAAPQE